MSEITITEDLLKTISELREMSNFVENVPLKKALCYRVNEIQEIICNEVDCDKELKAKINKFKRTYFDLDKDFI